MAVGSHLRILGEFLDFSSAISNIRNAFNYWVSGVPDMSAVKEDVRV